jgi:hypothetical protein
VDLLRLGEAKLVDVARCEGALREGALREAEVTINQTLVKYTPTDEVIRLCELLPIYGGTFTIRRREGVTLYDARAAASCRDEMGNALSMLTQTTPFLIGSRIDIEVEAGKTYYVKWFVSHLSQKMELVDAAKGAKEIIRLRLAKDQVGDSG